MKKTIPRRFCGILDHFRYLPLMLLLLASLSLTHPALGQGGPCDQISFSMDPLDPCEFAARYQTQTDCYIELRFILTQGEFASFDVNTAAGFMVQQVSPSELWVTHEFGFIPTGNQVPFLFSLPYDLTTSMSVAFLNDCAQVGCEILGGYPIDPCPDPQTASVIGVKYRECNGLPYINQDKLPGWTIQLLDEAGNIIREEQTDVDGNYAFYDLPRGNYYCREVQQPGWTPNVPPSGEVFLFLEATEQRIINFGNCRDCSCDSIRWTIIPISTGINECCYRLTIQNNDAGCFPDIKINLDPGLAISSWSLSAPGWSVTPLGTTGIQANPPGGFVPAGTVSPITFCVTGGAQHTMTTHTSYTNGQMSVLCETMDTFNCSSACPDPYNYVQNGNFEQGTPPGGDESIGFAAFWSAIWDTGCPSSADFYNTITAPPFGVLNPMPVTQGNFGGMWAKPHGSNLDWREGMMNQITPIAANSGTYQMTAKFACLTPVLPTSNAILPVIEVWGVPAGPPVIGTCPGLFGANSSIFPGSVLLGTFTPTANCDKNFQTFNNFTFSAPGFLMDRIFLTREQAFPGADVYVAVDDICLTKIGGTDCVCAPNSQLQLNYNGNAYPLFCGQGPFSQALPCPTSPVNVTGVFGCVDASGGPCPNYTVDWVLSSPSAGVIAQGAIVQGGPVSLNFPASLFAAGGDYMLRMTTLCPGQTDSCRCISRWIFDCCAADANFNVGPCGNVSFMGFGNGTSPYAFCWDFDGNLSTCESTLQNPTYQFTPGTHTATLQITDANGCVATYSVTFTVPPYPTSATISGNLTICPGQSTTLTAGGWNWTSCQWSNSGSGASITVNVPGTYCVTCSDVNGCTATACATVVQLPAPAVNITGNLTICLGQSTTLTATGGGTYSWTPGGATSAAITVNPTTTSTYTVLVTGANGCTATKSVTVTVNPLPQADAGPNQTVCQWQTATLTATGGVSYQWSPNNSTANPYITTPIQSHMLFTVTVTGANGCTAVDQMKVLTQVCDCDMNPFVQNGEFENGNPCILPDEDIHNATSWRGIWPNNLGFSTGDYYNTTTCTPTASFPVLATPAPVGCGAFGGFWCFPHSNDVAYREGILNDLSPANLISPNSGSYMVSMKMACLTPVSAAPRMSVYGVVQGAQSTIISTSSLTTNTPGNPSLFDLNGQPGAVQLGTVHVLSNCNNNFMDVGFMFNSNILPGTIDRVFLTRDDGLGGFVYLAVDSFCVKPVFDSTTCQCGLLTYAGVYQYVTGWQRPISPGQAPLTLPCPKPGANYSVAGLYHCSPDQCGNNTVDWILDRPAPLPDLTGQSSLAPHPFFHVLLNASDFSQSGNYQLTVTRHCGSTPCSKVFNFKLDNCPCSCDSLDTDVAYGFSMSNSSFPANFCKKRFKPLALCNNDVVNWNIQEVGGSYNATGTSIGNAYFQFGTAVNQSGYYDVCMKVTRAVNGVACSTDSVCRRVYIQCTIDPVSPALTRYCDENAVKNGGFNEGSSEGLLNEWGYLAHWDKFGNPGDGQVWVEDTSYAGSLDEGYVVMRGRAGNFAGIVQSVNLVESPYLAIYFDAINYLAAEAPAGTRIDVRLQAEPFWHPDMPTLPLRTYTLSDANGWRGMGGIIPLDSIPTSMRYLVICLQNDDDTENSIVGLDNIEVCNSATTPAPEAVGQTTLPIRIYPNPNTGQFTVDLSAPARPGTLFRITDLSGRMVQEVRTEAGNTQQRIQSGNLPDGMYFLQVLENGSLIGVKKFVKQ